MVDYLGFEPLMIPRGAFDPRSMSVGEPSPPSRVVWEGRECRVRTVERAGVSTAPDRGGSGERYRDRHLFRLVLDDGTHLEAYFERRPRDRRQRWWGRAIQPPVADTPGDRSAPPPTATSPGNRAGTAQDGSS